MTITKKLYLMTGIAFFLLIMIAGINLLSNRAGSSDLTRLIDHNVVPLMALQQIDRDLLEVRYRIIAVSTGMMPRSAAKAHLNEVRQKASQNWKAFSEAHHGSNVYGDEIGKIDSGLKVTSLLFDKLNKLYDDDDRKGMEAFLEDEWPQVIAQVTRPVSELVTKEAKAMQEERAASESNARNRINFAFAVLAFASVAILVQATLLVKSIRRSISSIQDVLVEIGKGNLTVRAPDKSGDEVGVMARSLNGALNSINEILNDVKRSSGSLLSGSSELMYKVSDAKQLLQEQSNQVTKVSAEMEELTVSITEVSHRASEIAQTAVSTRNAVSNSEATIESNRQAMQRALSSVEGTGIAVTELTSAILKISEVTQVIKDVASQTNLLALNAAIEAARAGEQGRGFAVVADEVRKLAERTTSSTADITATVELIKDKTSAASQSVSSVVDDVKESAGKSDLIMESLASILKAADSLTHLAEDIAAATAEQSTVASQTALSMVRIADMSERTNSVITQVADHAERASGMSNSLKNGVSRFTIA